MISSVIPLVVCLEKVLECLNSSCGIYVGVHRGCIRNEQLSLWNIVQILEFFKQILLYFMYKRIKWRGSFILKSSPALKMEGKLLT
jgi:hypothetical protein